MNSNIVRYTYRIDTNHKEVIVYDLHDDVMFEISYLTEEPIIEYIENGVHFQLSIMTRNQGKEIELTERKAVVP